MLPNQANNTALEFQLMKKMKAAIMLRSFWCRKWSFLSQKPVQVYSLCMPNISSFVSACVWHIGYYFVSYFHDALDQPNNYLIMSGLIISFICTKLLFSKNIHHIILFITLITTNTRYSGCLNNFSNKFFMVFVIIWMLAFTCTFE